MIKKTLFVTAIAACAFMASQALASPCSDDQESQAGMLAAGVSKDAVSKVVAVTGKQMVSVDACEAKDGNFIIEYKYNFLGDGGVYWVAASAKFGPGGASPSIKFTGKSPSLAAAEAKSGVKLSFN